MDVYLNRRGEKVNGRRGDEERGIRRSSRSVTANIAEAFRKRRCEKAFVAKLSDSEAEAAETQVWLDYAYECGYIISEKHRELYSEYDKIIGKLVMMIYHPEK
jgi:four helix bundle protein